MRSQQYYTIQPTVLLKRLMLVEYLDLYKHIRGIYKNRPTYPIQLQDHYSIEQCPNVAPPKSQVGYLMLFEYIQIVLQNLQVDK